MNTELKKAIIDFMFDNSSNFQSINQATYKFRPYIFDPSGNYLIGGEKVSSFIHEVDKLLKI